MISIDELRRLAGVVAPDGCITFYFRPEIPQNKAHSEERLLIRELVKAQLRRFRHGEGRPGIREALERIADLGEQMKGNHSLSKVVFACPEQGIWHEYDLSSFIERTALIVNSRFHLGPLATMAFASTNVEAALVDKERARFFEMRDGVLVETDSFRDDLPRSVRSDGFAGYDAGHIHRHVDNWVMQHMKHVAEHLKDSCQNRKVERILIGCREEIWPHLEPQLHSYVLECLAGRFVIDPALATAQQVREHVERLLAQRRQRDESALIAEAVGEAERNGRGAAGLKHVLTALERGEVQSVVINRNLVAKIVECNDCGHLDTRMVANCAVCGNETREIEDVVMPWWEERCAMPPRSFLLTTPLWSRPGISSRCYASGPTRTPPASWWAKLRQRFSNAGPRDRLV